RVGGGADKRAESKVRAWRAFASDGNREHQRWRRRPLHERQLVLPVSSLPKLECGGADLDGPRTQTWQAWRPERAAARWSYGRFFSRRRRDGHPCAGEVRHYAGYGHATS